MRFIIDCKKAFKYLLMYSNSVLLPFQNIPMTSHNNFISFLTLNFIRFYFEVNKQNDGEQSINLLPHCNG